MLSSFGLGRIRIRGFRSARDVSFAPGALCALVGEAGSGKSNVLSALWRLLSPQPESLQEADFFRGTRGRVVVGASFGDRPISLSGRPSQPPVREGEPPTALFLPAALRSEQLVDSRELLTGSARQMLELLVPGIEHRGRSAAAPALAFVQGMEQCCAAGVTGVVLLLEEPELFLRPQTQRYLYRLLRRFASNGNQVLYSTHAPAFLNVGRLEELVLVEHDGHAGTTVVQPQTLPADESFRALSEFDAERSELFLARAALLVEGRTEKLAFPFLFRALGHDPDREGISIVECGGKSNIVLFAQICGSVHVPYLVVHDRDAPSGRQPILSERAVNAAIEAVAGTERVIELVPDFEGVAGLVAHSHKPEHAWHAFAASDRAQVPAPLADAVRRASALASA